MTKKKKDKGNKDTKLTTLYMIIGTKMEEKEEMIIGSGPRTTLQQKYIIKRQRRRHSDETRG